MQTGEYCLTTIDNPYDPYEEWDQWYMYDVTSGYNTCQYLDAIAITSELLTDEENETILRDAIDEICAMNVNTMYKKAYKRS